jgi:hypothetical protein
MQVKRAYIPDEACLSCRQILIVITCILRNNVRTYQAWLDSEAHQEIIMAKGIGQSEAVHEINPNHVRRYG